MMKISQEERETIKDKGQTTLEMNKNKLKSILQKGKKEKRKKRKEKKPKKKNQRETRKKPIRPEGFFFFFPAGSDGGRISARVFH